MNLLFFIFYLLIHPELWLYVFKGVYLPVYIQYLWLRQYPIGTAIDVGAYRGDVSKTLRILFPKATIYAFEPVIENYELAKRILRRDNIRLYHFALDQKTGRAMLYVHKNSALSSLLPSPRARMERNERVPITTLDSFFRKKEIKEDVFLKIDTQGNEDRILKGAKNLLTRVSIIHIEMSFERFYQGQALFQEIYALLTRSGFRFVGQAREAHFYPLFHFEPQVNCVFIKKNFRFFPS